MSRASATEPERPARLGVGLIYSPALDGFLERRPDAVDVIEVEPQTYWLADHPIDGPFRPLEDVERLIERHPHRRLIHSVGCPLGGTRPPSAAQGRLLRNLAERWQVPWVSEHLSVAGTHHEQAGFLLPPRQTPVGAAGAARNAARFAELVGRPVLLEVGVNYLRPTPQEMGDADFMVAVSAAADCGILLDLHNAYCNERNGRGSLETFVARLPSERVREIHLAGGMEHEGYWLDAHSGPMPTDLVRRACSIVRGLPNVGAVVFEIYSTYIERIGEDELLRILDEVRRVWDNVGQARGDGDPRLPDDAPAAAWAPAADAGGDPGALADILAWEETLTGSVSGRDSAGRAKRMLPDEPALALYRTLVASFRGSMLLRTLPMTVRYLFTVDRSTDFLDAFYAASPPQLYAILEARAFVAHLAASRSGDALLGPLAAYELGTAETRIDGRARVVRFEGDPTPLFAALRERRDPPERLEPPAWEIELVPDDRFDAPPGQAGPS